MNPGSQGVNARMAHHRLISFASCLKYRQGHLSVGLDRAAAPTAQFTNGTSFAGGVLRLRPQRTMPSIMTMPMPGMSPS